jgi:LPS-assembly protein
MINRFLKIFQFLFFFIFTLNAHGNEQFNFDVTEILILDNGNKFIGKNKGTITSDSGVIIEANQFEYDKKLNILNAHGNVKINDTVNSFVIFTDKVIYDKKKEIIITKVKSKGISLNDNITIISESFIYNKLLNTLEAKNEVLIEDKNRNFNLYSNFVEYLRNEQIVYSEGDSKIIDLNDKSEITAENFEYNLNQNILKAEKNVKLENKKENYQIFSEFITYLKNEEKIFTKEKTKAVIQSKYNFNSSDVTFLKNTMELMSENNTTITDNLNFYKLDKFHYFINKKELKGEKILITSNYKLPESDNFYFSNAIINLNTQNFIAKDTKIKIHKSVFNNTENDPRLYGSSSIKKGHKTIINKGVFTNCKESEKCPPWAIQAEKIVHDENKKQLLYENALLKVYDFPVFYFPKFFHPDPTVIRQSGFLRPQINSSDELGDSIHLPYFYVISPTKDITFKPTLFNDSIKMFQNEYRQKNENSSFIADFSLTTGYKSSLSDTKNSISHLFAKYNSDLALKNFNYSNLYVSVQKVTNDTYLKVFDTNLPETKLKPGNQNNLSSEVELTLNGESFSFNSGAKVFENLTKEKNDRYQYILPYYNFDKNFISQFNLGDLYFSSSGSNDLNNTNKLKTKIINNLDFKSNDKISNRGLVNNFNIYFKNSNTLGKNDENYKSSPQVELMNIYEFSSKLPMQKKEGNYNNYLTPKLSLRFNPSDMKDYSSSSKQITVDNVFNINRLGLDDSFEKGKSLTVGLDYKKQKLDDINKYFELKLASVFRDTEENFIPSNSSLNKKNSNLFGSFESKFSENFTLDYDFRIDNNYDRFEYNSIGANFIFNNLETEFNFVEESGDAGDTNFLKNTTSYKINDSNYFSFSTRRNRKLNLTEFYDLVYEYKNDCLIASVKYKKKYYSDRDLKPSENLLLTLTLYPFTTYEHNETNLFKN